MKIGIFANGDVGFEAVVYLLGLPDHPEVIVLDENDTGQANSRIRELLKSTSIPILYCGKNPGSSLIASLSDIDMDLAILAWWPYILRNSMLKIAKLGILNFHPSLLPYNRGKHYNFWTIVEESPFGVTLHWIDDGIDSGQIAFQSQIEKTWEDTGQTLYYKAKKEILRLFRASYPEIRKGRIPKISQDLSKDSFHAAVELIPASEIHLNKSYRARDLLNVIRAKTFPPHPGAWFVEDGVKYEVRISINRIDSRTQDE